MPLAATCTRGVDSERPCASQCEVSRTPHRTIPLLTFLKTCAVSFQNGYDPTRRVAIEEAAACCIDVEWEPGCSPPSATLVQLAIRDLHGQERALLLVSLPACCLVKTVTIASYVVRALPIRPTWVGLLQDMLALDTSETKAVLQPLFRSTSTLKVSRTCCTALTHLPVSSQAETISDRLLFKLPALLALYQLPLTVTGILGWAC